VLKRIKPITVHKVLSLGGDQQMDNEGLGVHGLGLGWKDKP